MHYLTIAEAAEALHLSVPTIKRYIYEGKLRSTKLPGGQHRIPQSEIDRILSPEAAPGARMEEAAPPSLAERIAVLERWVTELESEVERLTAALEVVSRYCALHVGDAPHADEKAARSPSHHRLLVLGPGCRRCDTLYDLVQRALLAGGYRNVSVERVKDLDGIAGFGPVLTPALVMDGTVIVAGRIPSGHDLQGILERHLGPPNPPEA
ncbi:MAG TPA: thioredoxin family protein [Armatimonadota bacterium]|nr:thioredoxin family protein [Armatimonadota bacterium]HOM81913.1 thioredoxin family protein [Armatimonadota bacterium]HPO72902.1 thioredoxin family protein [Armatimonadota bacterium]HPT97800.1 thioredoxin family protein [Armatimonadota bacterium]